MGYIYILTNPSFPNFIKIGYADNVEDRLRTLNSSSAVPFSFVKYATYEVHEALKDKSLHRLIDQLNPDLRAIEFRSGKERVREFYQMSPEDGFNLLRSIADISETTDRLVKYTRTEEERSQEAESREASSGRFSFIDCGIPVGSTITFIHDEHKTAVVVPDNKVEYRDGCKTITTSLSSLARMLEEERTGKKYKTLQGPRYFRYQGRSLLEIAKSRT